MFIMKKHYFNLFVAIATTIFIATGCGCNTTFDYLGDINTYDPLAPIETTAESTTAETESVTEELTTTVPETTTEEPTTTVPETTEAETITVSKKYSDILRVCSTKAICETDINACYVDVTSEHNPYDVVWNYGEEYNAYVEACDWSLVWDYDYYIKTFPILAELYHYDRDLLLEHFQTVGIHEGRQGSADFNFVAFRMNSDCYDYAKVYAAYYFDYMLNHEYYNDINTVTINNGYTVYLQYDTLYTAAQMRELTAVNEYRTEVNADLLYADGELTCFANLRGYINLVEGYYAHEWFECNNFENANHYANIIAPNIRSISENCIEGTPYGFPESYVYANAYRVSEPHYKAMVDSRYDYIGVSHVYLYDSEYRACQFDMFIEIE